MPAGLSESEFKRESERIMRQIRATKIEGLKADLEREKLVTQRKQKAVEVAQAQLRQEEIRLEIENTKVQILQENLNEERVKLEIAQTKTGQARDKLDFERRSRDLQRGLYREQLSSMDLSLGESEFDNTDRRQLNTLKEINTGPSRVPASLSLN